LPERAGEQKPGLSAAKSEDRVLRIVIPLERITGKKLAK
jgi:hypothetical protein